MLRHCPRWLFLSLLAATACGREAPPVAGPSATTNAAVAASTGAASATGGSATGVPTVLTHCLSAAEIDGRLPLQWKLRHPLSVIKVAPDDVLNLRSGPGPHNRVVAKLAHDQRGIVASGKVCEIKGGLWLAVNAGGEQGWANAKFLMPTTKPKNKTVAYQQLLAGSYPTAAALMAAITKAKQATAPDPEVVYRVKLLGTYRASGTMTALFHQCCYADDALAGEQVWLTLKENNGRWRLDKAREVLLCPRGSNGKQCF